MSNPTRREMDALKRKLLAQPIEEPPPMEVRMSWARKIETLLKIRPERAGLEPFILNWFQRQVLAYVVKCIKSGKPVRLVVCKSRQLGISTVIQAILFLCGMEISNLSTLTLGHVRKSSAKIFNMSRRYYDNLPEDYRKRFPLEGGKPHKDHIEYAKPHSSEHWVQTAGGGEVGRSETNQIIHFSEIAFYEDGETVLQAAIESVPKPEKTPFTMIFMESTAKGAGIFKYYWDLAGEKDSEWHRMFFSWKDDKRCRLPVPESGIEMDDEEARLAKLYNLDAEQVLWMRRTRKDELQGSWARFHQEQPIAPELAFQYSGHPVFDSAVMQEQIKKASEVKPAYVGDIEFLSATEPIPRLKAA